MSQDLSLNESDEAARLIQPDSDFQSPEALLEGARQILVENWSENPVLLSQLREHLWKQGVLSAQMLLKDKVQAKVWAEYEHFSQALRKISWHRVLDLFKARRERALGLNLTLPEGANVVIDMMAAFLGIDLSQASAWIKDTLAQTWSQALMPKLEFDLFNRLRQAAEEEAMTLCAGQLRDRIRAAPAGPQALIVLDPSLRAGIKALVLDAKGQSLDALTLLPAGAKSAVHDAVLTLAKLVSNYDLRLVGIVHQAGFREAEQLIAEFNQMYPDMALAKVLLPSLGLSEGAAASIDGETPDLEPKYLSTLSLARRLQDPLQELVNIDPSLLKLNPYQQDLNPQRLLRRLNHEIAAAVHAVGVDLNHAPWRLLSKLSGVTDALAQEIVRYRDLHGPFKTRDELKHIPQIDDKRFEQMVGFVRISDAVNPLDKSRIHPESYPLVQRMAEDLGMSISDIMANQEALMRLTLDAYIDPAHGRSSLEDILQELLNPGADPRPVFRTVAFKEGINSIDALQLGMVLEGVVSNVTHFGVFVDLGVQQDGLVHISAMDHAFITNPAQFVSVGDIIRVKVIEVDISRKRIGLSMKITEAEPLKTPLKNPRSQRDKHINHKAKAPARPQEKTVAKKPTQVAKPLMNSRMADALSKLKSELKL